MTMTDPIADFLTRIRNAQLAKFESVECPSSRIKVALCKVLEDEGYIAGHSVVDSDGKPVLRVRLKYHDGKPVIEEIRRVSRPGLRDYKGKDNIPVNRAGLGISILSTNKGLMTDRQAIKAGVGGEVICSVF